jgi:hypothetical protein
MKHDEGLKLLVEVRCSVGIGVRRPALGVRNLMFDLTFGSTPEKTRVLRRLTADSSPQSYVELDPGSDDRSFV